MATDTAEYLRTRVRDQYDQEMLCAGVLRVESEYSQVTNIKPDGGSDNAHDITCLMGENRAIAGVSFVKSALDSPKQRSAIRAKIIADARNSRTWHPVVKTFIYFTNITFSADGAIELQLMLRAMGFDHVVAYDRNKIAQVLDCPRGYHLRGKYLNLPMSDVEWASFYDECIEKARSAANSAILQISKSVDRLSFLTAAAQPIGYVRAIIRFKETPNPEPFTISIVLTGPCMPSERRMLVVNLEKVQGSIRATWALPNSKIEFSPINANWLDERTICCTFSPRYVCSQSPMRLMDLSGGTMDVLSSTSDTESLEQIDIDIDGYAVAMTSFFIDAPIWSDDWHHGRFADTEFTRDLQARVPRRLFWQLLGHFSEETPIFVDRFPNRERHVEHETPMQFF